MTYPAVPHLAFPLRRAPAGELLAVEQDTLEDVRQCVHVLLRTPRGARPLAPDVGIEDPTFTSGVQAEVLQAQLEDDEDRAHVDVAAGRVGPTGAQAVQVNVQLREDFT